LSDGARVLIVDDQPANIRVMAEALRDRHELFFATSGAKALEIAAAGAVDLILLDVVMPDLDGFEVCARLKSDERTRRIPVIFVTAREEVSDEERGFDAGGVDYITKPIRPPVVRARVRTHLELKHARDLLEKLALVDPLTGIANRRRFDESLADEWKRAARANAWFSLAIVDVDDFKKYNDRYGHTAGDDCLRAVAGAIASVARRPGDLAARYGGEEFALLLPQTDADAMSSILRRLLIAIDSLAIDHAASTCGSRVSVSAGAVSLIATVDTSSAAVLETADKLLYEAKRGGRCQAVHLDQTRDAKESVALQLEPSR
jgi:diguanylate cyclase (GGDEF)-like protein